MSANPLQRLGELGQSVWYDFIRRDLYQGPELKRLIEQDGLRGMTSNPTIFQKAIAESSLYDEDIRRAGEAGKDPAAIFEDLAVTDVRAAADIFRPVYDASGGDDGFVSIEVAPHLARDTQGTIAEARRLWSSCGRPNVMVKIPGTAEGVPAIRQCLSEGININITLLFSVPRYREVMDAYLGALEERARRKEKVNRIRSVASFFVSRVDTNVDKKLDALTKAGNAKAAALRAKLAIANARLAYQAFQEVFAGPRFAALKGEGGSPPAAAVGLDLDQGPVAAGSLLRRGAHRADLGRHDAAGDVRRVQRPRRSQDPHRRRSAGRPGGLRRVSPASASTSPRWPESSRTRE